MAITETIAGVAGAISGLTQLATAISKAGSSEESKGLLIEFQNCIIQANQAAMAAQAESVSLLARNRELEVEVARLNDWATVSADYTLKEVGTGYFVYAYMPLGEPRKPKHWICVTCFEDGDRSILQRNYATSFKCPKCETEIEPMASGRPIEIGDV